ALATTAEHCYRTPAGAAGYARAHARECSRLRSAYHAARRSGISAGAWALILGELPCFLIYGWHESDPRLIALGASGSHPPAPSCSLASCGQAGRPVRTVPRQPLANDQGCPADLGRG